MVMWLLSRVERHGPGDPRGKNTFLLQKIKEV